MGAKCTVLMGQDDRNREALFKLLSQYQPAKVGYLVEVKGLIDLIKHLNYVDDLGKSPLYMAVQKSAWPIVEKMLSMPGHNIAVLLAPYDRVKKEYVFSPLVKAAQVLTHTSPHFNEAKKILNKLFEKAKTIEGLLDIEDASKDSFCTAIIKFIKVYLPVVVSRENLDDLNWLISIADDIRQTKLISEVLSASCVDAGITYQTPMHPLLSAKDWKFEHIDAAFAKACLDAGININLVGIDPVISVVAAPPKEQKRITRIGLNRQSQKKACRPVSDTVDIENVKKSLLQHMQNSFAARMIPLLNDPSKRDDLNAVLQELQELNNSELNKTIFNEEFSFDGKRYYSLFYYWLVHEKESDVFQADLDFWGKCIKLGFDPDYLVRTYAGKAVYHQNLDELNKIVDFLVGLDEVDHDELLKEVVNGSMEVVDNGGLSKSYVTPVHALISFVGGDFSKINTELYKRCKALGFDDMHKATQNDDIFTEPVNFKSADECKESSTAAQSLQAQIKVATECQYLYNLFTQVVLGKYTCLYLLSSFSFSRADSDLKQHFLGEVFDENGLRDNLEYIFTLLLAGDFTLPDNPSHVLLDAAAFLLSAQDDFPDNFLTQQWRDWMRSQLALGGKDFSAAIKTAQDKLKQHSEVAKMSELMSPDPFYAYHGDLNDQDAVTRVVESDIERGFLVYFSKDQKYLCVAVRESYEEGTRFKLDLNKRLEWNDSGKVVENGWDGDAPKTLKAYLQHHISTGVLSSGCASNDYAERIRDQFPSCQNISEEQANGILLDVGKGKAGDYLIIMPDNHVAKVAVLSEVAVDDGTELKCYLLVLDRALDYVFRDNKMQERVRQLPFESYAEFVQHHFTNEILKKEIKPAVQEAVAEGDDACVQDKHDWLDLAKPHKEVTEITALFAPFRDRRNSFSEGFTIKKDDSSLERQCSLTQGSL